MGTAVLIKVSRTEEVTKNVYLVLCIDHTNCKLIDVLTRHSQIDGKLLRVSITKYKWKHLYGRVNNPGYGKKIENWTTRSKVLNHINNNYGMDEVHRLNGNGSSITYTNKFNKSHMISTTHTNNEGLRYSRALDESQVIWRSPIMDESQISAVLCYFKCKIAWIFRTLHNLRTVKRVYIAFRSYWNMQKNAKNIQISPVTHQFWKPQVHTNAYQNRRYLYKKNKYFFVV